MVCVYMNNDKSEVVNLRLTAEEKRQIVAIAAIRGESISAVIRQWIQDAYRKLKGAK